MSGKKAHDSDDAFERPTAGPQGERYVLRLFITGMTPLSVRAIDNVKNLCEQHLQGRYELEVIDLYQQPQLAQGEQIIAVPTLIRKMPLPPRRVIGDMSKTERVLAGLDLRGNP